MTMFMRRGFELTAPNGYWAMIDLPSWMFLTTFAAFREWLLDESWMQSVAPPGSWRVWVRLWVGRIRMPAIKGPTLVESESTAVCSRNTSTFDPTRRLGDYS